MAFTYVKESSIGLGYKSGVVCDYKPVYYAWVNRGQEKKHNLSWGPEFSKREVREEILKELRNKIRDQFNVEC